MKVARVISPLSRTPDQCNSAEEADARPLLAELERTATIPDVQCRFRWSPEAFWDNRATQHCVSNDFLPHRRVMERVTVAGDRPY